MALGATGSAQMARDIAYASGRELRVLGINMNLVPVVDVNNNPDNPVIGPRSFGEDPHHVGLFTTSVVQGYREAGLMTCLKHFPGHGDTSVDSHRFLPSIPHTIERLEAVELVPFKSGIAAGAASVMVAHIAFPSITPVAAPGNDTRALAATASPVIVQELLREQLGFDGVIIIMLTMNAHLYRQQAEMMQGLIHLHRRLIGIAVYNPYDLLAFPQLGTYLATYECTPPALEAIARVLFGMTQAKGRLPVSLPGMYPRGYSMPTKSSRFVT